MTTFKDKANSLIETLEQQSSKTRNFAELELLILKATQDLGQLAATDLTTDEAFPPQYPCCPKCQKAMRKSETRNATLKTLWGEIKHPRTRYRCHQCHTSQTIWQDSSLDSSHCTPLVLARLEEFAVEVPYRKACQFMHSGVIS